MGNRDWLYLLGLLVPLVVYNLVLKVVRVLSYAEVGGLFGAFGLIRSDVLFNVGYMLLWIGLFTLARGGLLRRVVVVLTAIAVQTLPHYRTLPDPTGGFAGSARMPQEQHEGEADG